MSDLPNHVEIHEEGPREGFQIEPGPISTQDKIKVIEALAETGLTHVQACSFVSPRIVPGWADAEDVVAGFTPKEGVEYTALWFNAAGLGRLCFFDTERKAILLVAGDKSGVSQKRFYKALIRRADDRFDEHLAALEGERRRRSRSSIAPYRRTK